MRTSLITSLIIITGCASFASAQSEGDLQVPAAALTILELPTDRALSLVMSRAIRLLHSSPFDEKSPPPHKLELDQLLADLDRVEEGLGRGGNRGLSLDMTKTNTERTVLKGSLESIGLRMRERKKVYTVEPGSAKSDVALRATLRAAGIDAEAIAKRLNAGETVVVAPRMLTLPLPLTPSTWSDSIFRRPLPSRALFASIIRDRKASLLYAGLQAMTPLTLAYVSKNQDFLRHLLDTAGPVAAFGGAFQIGADGRVVIPGGAQAAELWEALVDEPIAKPDRFGRAIFEHDGGRLAYFFNTLAHLDDPHRAFALGLWLTDRAARLERFRTLYHAFATIDAPWVVADVPFRLPAYDPASLLTIVAVARDGNPSPPIFRKLWAQVFDSDDVTRVEARDLREVHEDGMFDAAWLADRIAGLKPPERRVRIEQLAFGQRRFGDASLAQLPDVLVALRGFARFRTVMLAAERIGATDPAVYAALARHARALEQIGDPSRAVPMLSQFQAAVAILERVSRTGTVPRDERERLIRSLSALQIDDQRYDGRVLQWIRADLLPALPPLNEPGSSAEERLLSSMVEHPSQPEPFRWEGDAYTFDPSVARNELKAVRLKQGGNGLDAILSAFAPTDALAHQPGTVEQVKALTATLRLEGGKLAPPRAWPDAPDSVPELKKILERAVRDLAKITKPQDVSKASGEVKDVQEALDYLLGETLVAIAYAPALGDPDAIVGADVSHRHTFGVANSDEAARRIVWQRAAIGSRAVQGDALTGSLLELDLALATRLLRRIANDRLPGPPKLNSNDTETFVRTIALLNPRDLTDDQLARIGAALERGERRIEAAVTDAAARDAAAIDSGMNETRRELFSWAATHEPKHAHTLFSVGESFWLGLGIADETNRRGFAPWGMSYEPVNGCYCLGFPEPGTWERVAGRQSTNQLASGIPDVNLRVAGLMAELKVPAALFPGVMAMAMQDYLDTVPAMYEEDWEAISGHAWQITREQVEDYVSAFVAKGPVRATAGSTR